LANPNKAGAVTAQYCFAISAAIVTHVFQAKDARVYGHIGTEPLDGEFTAGGTNTTGATFAAV